MIDKVSGKSRSMANLKGGSRKGVPNKSTVAVKEALHAAFDGIGGVPALITWAKAQPTEFYKLYAKLLPVDMNVKAEVETRIISDQPLTPEEWAQEHAPRALQ